MRKSLIHRALASTGLTVFLLLGESGMPASGQGIDRKAVVTRHNPVTYASAKRSPAQVGNGRFAFGADITGLQTFRAFNTLSDWGWHSFPMPEGHSLDEYQKQPVESWGRSIPYLLRDPEHPEISDWLRGNPHRIDLARIGLRLLKADGSEAQEGDLAQTRQETELWTGVLKSSFLLDGEEVSIRTACHPDLDLVSIRINSLLVDQGRIVIFLDLPYASGREFENFVGDYGCPERHSSTVRETGPRRRVITHALDSTVYEIGVEWIGDAEWERVADTCHLYRLMPQSGDSFSLTVHFRPVSIPGLELSEAEKSPLTTNEAPGATEVERASAEAWERFWKSGAAIDLSVSKDPRWRELERRIVLSQYILRLNESGLFPPQESGLVNNGWFGRYHWEMIWWHGAQFTLWGRQDCINTYLQTYRAFLPEAKARAAVEGRSGARWPKCTAHFNREWPCEPHAMLCWQQPHPIWFAEAEYRANPCQEVLDKWAEILCETADYMADYVFWDKAGKRYVIGPPVIPVSENTKMMETLNPIFELGYWRYGLRTALEWAKRLKLPARRTKAWKTVLDKLAPLPMEDGCYITHEKMEDMWGSYNFEHPALTGVYGWLPGDGVDVETARRTFYKVLDTWQMERIWGWDYPMLAMAAARLGDPAKAVDLLCTTAQKFAFDEHGLADMWPFPYFPANGGLLTAVAMMCAGWEGVPNGVAGSSGDAPGFPQDGSWTVRHEGFQRMQ